ncbi:ABC transporter permease [Psychromarinibacter sp. C21-152]|uniref:ABC transporter permease n=1 Tax=Psychromarinibacter sediminicola TaxID=3033385 RepID=A0AAE3NNQ1_9RHOB|nr:ABC transporter permease [Psychromarinibacter sediminicola]MDF0599631.1 ABC transporter permease [Psychromarinibacter sediminicola]
MSEVRTDMPAEELLDEAEPRAESRAAIASPLRLMWWKFKRHRVALWSGYFLLFAYLVMATAGFWAPSTPNERSRQLYAPPQWVKIIGPEGELRRPFVYGYEMTRDLNTLRPVYTRDESQIYPIELFVRGAEYKLLGLIPWDVHLFGVSEGYIYLAGTDSFGRDMFTRLVYGARITLSVGLVSVMLSLVLGLIIGGVSGLYGGWVDSVTQRVIEAIIAIPTIPLWLGLAAAVPRDWPAVYQYFAILVVLSLISWTSTARVARGRFLALREQDFVTAARVYGAGTGRIIRKHLVPNIMSYVIVTITLAIPTIIIGETALSFLGVGLRAPTVSWGVLLQEAQKIQVIQFYPWLWIGPALCVIVIVLAFNFVGDGARDAADPFSK